MFLQLFFRHYIIDSYVFVRNCTDLFFFEESCGKQFWEYRITENGWKYFGYFAQQSTHNTSEQVVN
jgi:hypothetical protein